MKLFCSFKYIYIHIKHLFQYESVIKHPEIKSERLKNATQIQKGAPPIFLFSHFGLSRRRNGENKTTEGCAFGTEDGGGLGLCELFETLRRNKKDKKHNKKRRDYREKDWAFSLSKFSRFCPQMVSLWFSVHPIIIFIYLGWLSSSAPSHGDFLEWRGSVRAHSLIFQLGLWFNHFKLACLVPGNWVPVLIFGDPIRRPELELGFLFSWQPNRMPVSFDLIRRFVCFR